MDHEEHSLGSVVITVRYSGNVYGGLRDRGSGDCGCVGASPLVVVVSGSVCV